MTSGNAKHSVTINGHRTSITLENEFWQSLREISSARGITVNTLIAEIDKAQPGNLSSAIRIHILKFYKSRP